MRKCCWRETPKELDLLQCLCVQESMQLKRFLKKYAGRAWTGLIWPRQGT
jgi:hypothetical protein